VAYTKTLNKNVQRKICFKNKNCDHLCREGQLSFSFPKLNISYRWRIFFVENLENSHKCVPFGLFITNINWLFLLILLSLAVFGFMLNKIPFKWYKVPTMLLEKVSIHTEIIFVHCYKILLLSLVLFLYLLKIV
jgi:hypothetical protein